MISLCRNGVAERKSFDEKGNWEVESTDTIKISIGVMDYKFNLNIETLEGIMIYP